MTGPELIAAIQRKSPQTPIIGMTAGCPKPRLDAERQRLDIHGLFSNPMSLHDLRRSTQTALQACDATVHTAA